MHEYKKEKIIIDMIYKDSIIHFVVVNVKWQRKVGKRSNRFSNVLLQEFICVQCW